MKKMGLQLGLLSFLLLVACGKKEEVRTDTVETRTIETVRDQPADTVVVKAVEEAPDGTSVKIDGNGISVDSKKSDDKVDVNVDVKK